jgi:hypothetical protein
MFGRKQPKLAEANSKRIWTEESKKSIRIKKSKPIKCIETGAVYSSVKEAGKILSTDPKLISEVARGIRVKTKGLTFVFIENSVKK